MPRIAILLLAALALLLPGCGYNEIQKNEEAVFRAWADVEATYQRRADLIPNLVETVKGARDFERDTLTAVVEARAKVGQVQVNAGQLTPESFAQFQQAQDRLSSALSRLLVVVEKYPELKATENFKELQAQLEGTENRIATERMRFNEAAQAFNTRRNRFPAVLVAGFFGGKFADKPFFKAQAGADAAPKVKF